MPFSCMIPAFGGGQFPFVVESGSSYIIVGANGSGKTRLGVFLENQVPGDGVQRLAAQKSLTLRDDLSIISFERADRFLRHGVPDAIGKHLHRWGNKPATHLLNDFDALQQALFSEHNRLASKHLQDRKKTPDIEIPHTQLERLREIWEVLLPHRTLEFTEASVRVRPAGATVHQHYPGSEMSDGERAIFYFIGQSLMAPKSAVIIVDEPESHIHRAILRPLWDAIERARPDCSFVHITHDLEFAVSRNATAKYFVRQYQHNPAQWDINVLPEDSGLPDDVVAELVGSRKPILFVEGEKGSLDLTIYGSVYANFTLISIGSCENVIHSVASYKNSAVLHWLVVRGLIDADDRNSEELAYLEARNVYSLPVVEIENIFALPNIFLALARAFMCPDPSALLEELKTRVVAECQGNIDAVCIRLTIRQIDRKLKLINIEAKNPVSLASDLQNKISTVDAVSICQAFKKKFEIAIADRDLVSILRLYPNKGLLSLVAQLLGLKNQKVAIEKVVRLLSSSDGDTLRGELNKSLPAIPV